jgi:hypothetical protein
VLIPEAPTNMALIATRRRGFVTTAQPSSAAISSNGLAATVSTQASSGVTITGSGFGTKTTAAPLLFNTFDALADGTLATNASIGLSALGINPSYVPAVQSTRSHSGTKALRLIYPTGQDSVFPGTGLNMPAGTTKLYYATWAYWEWTVGSSKSSFIFKWSRGGSNNNGGAYHGHPAFHNTLRPNAAGINGNGSGDTGYTRSDGVDFYDDTVLAGPNVDGWHFVEYKYVLSNPAGTANGMYQTLCDGTVNANLTSALTRQAADTSTIDWWMSIYDGNDTYGVSNEYRLYSDEMILQTELGRVIFTDNPVYPSSTKFAPQSCTTWTDTQITITSPNWSNFSSGATVYAHVWNSSDSHITAQAVTVP